MKKTITRALISVSDKTGVLEFCRELDQLGIELLSTGGTIASSVDYRTGAVTPALTASDLNEAVPEIAKIANVDAEVLFSEYSENLQPEHWIKTAEKINSYSK